MPVDGVNQQGDYRKITATPLSMKLLTFNLFGERIRI
jgi:hypothetical protein